MDGTEKDEGPASPTAMPVLETDRLRIRPYRAYDLAALHHILDVELDALEGESSTRAEREAYLRWSIMNYRELARLYQPPYGDRAIVRKEDETVIGACGLTSAIGPFGLLPSFSDIPVEARRYSFPLMGLYYALSPSAQGKGYATEAAQALLDYGFTAWNQWRIVATTSHENDASMAVMRRLGMRVERNPFPEPQWFQVVGVIQNPALSRQ